MNVINNVTNKVVIRPVACLDKIEIMDIARKIDTYETSILPYEDCCTVFVPQNPVIRPEISVCEEGEKELDIDKLIEECLASSTLMTVYEDGNTREEPLV